MKYINCFEQIDFLFVIIYFVLYMMRVQSKSYSDINILLYYTLTRYVHLLFGNESSNIHTVLYNILKSPRPLPHS